MEKLIELKKLAEKIYDMYLILKYFFEKDKSETIAMIAKAILEYESREEKILDSLDNNTLAVLYNYALKNVDNNNEPYLDKLYLFVVDYYNSRFVIIKDNVLETVKNATEYAFKKMFEGIKNDPLNLKSVDTNFYETLKLNLYPCFFKDIMIFSNFERLLLEANFDFNSIVIEGCESEGAKKVCMNLILYNEMASDKTMTAQYVSELLKRKYMFEYLVQNLSEEDYLEVKDYLFSLKHENSLIIEFKKVILERNNNDKRER